MREQMKALDDLGMDDLWERARTQTPSPEEPEPSHRWRARSMAYGLSAAALAFIVVVVLTLLPLGDEHKSQTENTPQPPAACQPAASSIYASGLAPGQIHTETEPVETTGQVLATLRTAGFPEVAIVRTATPWKVQLIRESDGDFQARVYWRLPGVSRLLMLQTCSIKFPSAGSPVKVRGHSGYREGKAFYWSERGYELVMDPGTPGRFALIEWRPTA